MKCQNLHIQFCEVCVNQYHLQIQIQVTNTLNYYSSLRNYNKQSAMTVRAKTVSPSSEKFYNVNDPNGQKVS